MVIIAGSFLVMGTAGTNCQPTVLMLCGFVVFLAARSQPICGGIVSWFASVLLLLVLTLMWQWQVRQQLCSVFSNSNYLAAFMATAVPIMLGAVLDGTRRQKAWLVVYSSIVAVSGLTILITHSRSALLGMGAGLAVVCMPMLSVRLRKWIAWLPLQNALSWIVHLCILVAICCIALVAFRYLYLVKPLSGAGRALIWSVSARMAVDAPFAGVGFGNFANTYNLFQAEYFAKGGGRIAQRMAADACRHAFNEPLEVVAELGIPGLVMLLLFAGLILNEVWKVVRRHSVAIVAPPVAKGIYRGTAAAPTLESDNQRPTIDYLTLGIAGAVVCFMVMSLFHFPRKVVPTWLVFNYALAWVVTANQRCKQGVNELKRRHKTLVVVGWRVFWFVAFVGSVALVPLYVKNYRDARRWIAAHELTKTGEVARAYSEYTELYPKLKWSGRFCAYYGNAVMAGSEKANASARIDSSAAREAVALYEKAKYTYPDPYMFENLAVAYLKLMDGTNWPVVVQTQYATETPAQVLMRKLREWRCGTNMFFEPPPTQLTQGDCIGRAIQYLTLASNILPWRLTSKWYLAQIYRDVGDVSNAVNYAQLVVNIPMKKDTPQGREFKRKAQKMLIELGVRCDDPGLVVFDIHDRKTWNEGKW
ncbi:MAG: O-antigen ligase family protein [bacterium]|nr:O-antigen ligase family protein [bacterium]